MAGRVARSGAVGRGLIGGLCSPMAVMAGGRLCSVICIGGGGRALAGGGRVDLRRAEVERCLV